ncbi:hypothetical protein D3C86_1492200 [compost metagenome]
MNLVTYHVMELNDVHDTNSRTLFKRFTVTTIKQLNFTVAVVTGFFKFIANSFVGYTVKWRSCNFVAEGTCSHTKVSFK